MTVLHALGLVNQSALGHEHAVGDNTSSGWQHSAMSPPAESFTHQVPVCFPQPCRKVTWVAQLRVTITPPTILDIFPPDLAGGHQSQPALELFFGCLFCLFLLHFCLERFLQHELPPFQRHAANTSLLRTEPYGGGRLCENERICHHNLLHNSALTPTLSQSHRFRHHRKKMP